jgi:hypothetical protein
MLTKPKRVYALCDYTVEYRPNGWYYARTGRFGDKSEVKGPGIVPGDVEIHEAVVAG